MGQDSPNHDLAWDIAWGWAQRHHERLEPPEADKAELAQWLAADPHHRTAYEKAQRLWLLTGLVPPKNDIG